MKRFTSVDLPTFGRPMMAIRVGLEPGQHGIHQRFDAVAVLRGDGERCAAAGAMELGADDAGVLALGLVHRERHGLAGAPDQARDEQILAGQADAAVDDEHEAVGLGDRALGLLAHQRLDAGGRRLDDAAGVDRDVRDGAQAAVAVLPVERHAGHVRDDGVAGAGERIEQGRLADVRPPDERNYGQHAMGNFR
jgi:hypothetical protein